MARSESTFIAIGGGGSSESIMEEFFDSIKDKRDASVVVMTVASNEVEGMRADYNATFHKHNVKHVSVIDIFSREDARDTTALKKIENADAIYFTGGDQLNVTSLFGGSPLDDLLHEKVRDGVVIAGTSAGAAMMASSMIKDGNGNSSPAVGSVETTSDLDLIENTVIDTHFAQRGRYVRQMDVPRRPAVPRGRRTGEHLRYSRSRSRRRICIRHENAHAESSRKRFPENSGRVATTVFRSFVRRNSGRIEVVWWQQVFRKSVRVTKPDQAIPLSRTARHVRVVF